MCRDVALNYTDFVELNSLIHLSRRWASQPRTMWWWIELSKYELTRSFGTVRTSNNSIEINWVCSLVARVLFQFHKIPDLFGRKRSFIISEPIIYLHFTKKPYLFVKYTRECMAHANKHANQMFNYRLKYKCSNTFNLWILCLYFILIFTIITSNVSTIYARWYFKYFSWWMINKILTFVESVRSTHSQHTQRHMWIHFWSLWSVFFSPKCCALENSIDQSIDHKQAQIVKWINKRKTVQNHKRKWLQFFFAVFACYYLA